MWISKKEYKHLKNIENHYEEHVSRRTKLFEEAVDRIQFLTTELDYYQSEAEKYKQKYADEVNKRLELIEYYERQINN